MRVRTAVCLALILLLAFLSGCTAKTSGSSSTSGTAKATGTSTVSGSSTAASSGTSAPNHPPSAELRAAVYGLQANLTLNATDADHDALSWTLTFGDGNHTTGAALPHNLTHLYKPGAYNLTLVVSDGKANSTARAHITLNATKAAFPPLTITGSDKLPCAQCAQGGANTGVGYRAGQNNLDYFWATVPANAAGQPFKLTSSGGNPDVVFRDSCSGGSAIGDPFQAGGPEAGVVPAGGVCALMWEEQATNSSFTLVIG